MNEKTEAIQESAEAHMETTGHDELDMLEYGTFPKVLVVSCHQCGQHIGSVRK